MKNTQFTLQKYEADAGMCFDWLEPHFDIIIQEDGTEEEVQTHLYAKTIFLSATDSINNYVEIPVPEDVVAEE